MTTKTSITYSPIKRCHGSSNLRKRRLSSVVINRKPIMICEKQRILPDIVHDILIKQQQQRETIVNIANTLRKVGDQIDQQLQVRFSYNHILNIYIYKKKFISR